jgi:hypothetical protein
MASAIGIAGMVAVIYGAAISLASGLLVGFASIFLSGSPFGLIIIAPAIAVYGWVVGMVGSLVIGFPLATIYRRLGVEDFWLSIIPGLALSVLLLGVGGKGVLIYAVNILAYNVAFWIAAKQDKLAGPRV